MSTLKTTPAFKLPARLATDPRISTQSTTVPSGQTYSYILCNPTTSKPTATILLLHGFPDLALAWRNQIPPLLALNIRLIVPNLLGYSSTSAPASPTHYTNKALSADLAALIKPLLAPNERVILGGHDWGGALVYRFALWHPDLVKGFFSICTPFAPPASSGAKFIHPADILPNFKYQLQLAGRDVEEALTSEDDIRRFLNGMYGGRSRETNKSVFVTDGIKLDILKAEGVTGSPLLSAEEIDLYVDAFMTSSRTSNGATPPLRGPLNWYRVHELNFNDERDAGMGDKWRKGGLRFEVPGLWVAGSKDQALPPVMGHGMEKWWAKGSGKGGLSKGEVNAGHWALWERGNEVTQVVVEWLGREFGIVGEDKSKL